MSEGEIRGETNVFGESTRLGHWNVTVLSRLKKNMLHLSRWPFCWLVAAESVAIDELCVLASKQKRGCPCLPPTSQCALVPLHPCPIPALSHCTPVPLHPCPIATLSHCIPVQLHPCPTATLSHCIPVPLHPCPIALLFHCALVPNPNPDLHWDGGGGRHNGTERDGEGHTIGGGHNWRIRIRSDPSPPKE